MIRDRMGDQEIGGNLEKYGSQGTTVYVRRRWVRDDEAGWPEAAQWIEEQHERLRTILGPVSEDSGVGSTQQGLPDGHAS